MHRSIIVLALANGASAQSLAQSLTPIGIVDPGCKAFVVTLAPDAREIVANCTDNKLRFMRLPGGNLRLIIDGGKTRFNVPTYSLDGTRLAVPTMQGEVRVYNTLSGSIIKVLKPSTKKTFSIALSGNGRTIAVAPYESPVELWNVDKATQIASLENPFSTTGSLAFSPDDKLLASADGDGVVRTYDAKTGRILSRYDQFLLEPFSVAFSPDSKKLAAGGADRFAVVIDPYTGKELQRLPIQADPIFHVAMPGAGRTVVAFMRDATGLSHAKNTTAWDLPTGKATVLTSGTSFIGGNVLADGRLMLVTRDGDNVKLWAMR